MLNWVIKEATCAWAPVSIVASVAIRVVRSPAVEAVWFNCVIKEATAVCAAVSKDASVAIRVIRSPSVEAAEFDCVIKENRKYQRRRLDPSTEARHGGRFRAPFFMGFSRRNR